MALNFKIVVSRERGNLHFNVLGDFDGSSALELVNALLENCGSVNRVFIHTNGLKEVHPFGKAVFQRHFPLAGRVHPSIVFSGKYAEDIAPHSKGDSDQQAQM